MTTYALEGTGTTIAFGTSNFASDLIKLTLPEQTRAELETTHLGTLVAKTRKPAKIKDVGEISCEFDHNPRAIKLIDQQPEPITISYPLQSGQTSPDTISFIGYAVKFGGEDFEVDKKMMTKCSLRVSGDLTFTPGT